MKRIFLALAGCLFSIDSSSGAPSLPLTDLLKAVTTPHLLGFERDSAIWIAQLDGTGAKRIAKGVDPSMSPDGKRIAFNTEGAKRQIAIFDLTTKQTNVFKDEIPSENCYGPVWSPDGSKIIFNFWSGSEWHLAAIEANGSSFRIMKKGGAGFHSYYQPCWAADSQSFYAQDLDKLYRFALDGKELQSWDLKALFPNCSLSSSSRMSLAPDGRRLLMEVDMDVEAVDIPKWDGPAPASWVLDLTTQKTNRITPKGTMAWNGCWLNNEQILFTSQTPKEKKMSICEMTLAEKNRKPILTNADNVTVAISGSQ